MKEANELIGPDVEDAKKELMDYQAKAKAEHPAFDCTDLGKPRCNLCGVVFSDFEIAIKHAVGEHAEMFRIAGSFYHTRPYVPLERKPLTVRELLKQIADGMQAIEDLDGPVEIETMDGGFTAKRVEFRGHALIIETE